MNHLGKKPYRITAYQDIPVTTDYSLIFRVSSQLEWLSTHFRLSQYQIMIGTIMEIQLQSSIINTFTIQSLPVNNSDQGMQYTEKATHDQMSINAPFLLGILENARKTHRGILSVLSITQLLSFSFFNQGYGIMPWLSRHETISHSANAVNNRIFHAGWLRGNLNESSEVIRTNSAATHKQPARPQYW